jgi:hypothetical protein
MSVLELAPQLKTAPRILLAELRPGAFQASVLSPLLSAKFQLPYSGLRDMDESMSIAMGLYRTEGC